jgi:hypothetical protein
VSSLGTKKTFLKGNGSNTEHHLRRKVPPPHVTSTSQNMGKLQTDWQITECPLVWADLNVFFCKKKHYIHFTWAKPKLPKESIVSF